MLHYLRYCCFLSSTSPYLSSRALYFSFATILFIRNSWWCIEIPFASNLPSIPKYIIVIHCRLPAIPRLPSHPPPLCSFFIYLFIFGSLADSVALATANFPHSTCGPFSYYTNTRCRIGLSNCSGGISLNLLELACDFLPPPGQVNTLCSLLLIVVVVHCYYCLLLLDYLNSEIIMCAWVCN